MSSNPASGSSTAEGLRRLILRPRRWRSAAGFAVAVAGPALVTAVASVPSPRGTAIPALLYLLVVVAAAVLGHLWPALLAAGLSFVGLDYFFTEPVHTFVVSKAEDLLALGVFLVVAATVSAAISAVLPASGVRPHRLPSSGAQPSAVRASRSPSSIRAARLPSPSFASSEETWLSTVRTEMCIRPAICAFDRCAPSISSTSASRCDIPAA